MDNDDNLPEPPGIYGRWSSEPPTHQPARPRTLLTSYSSVNDAGFTISVIIAVAQPIRIQLPHDISTGSYWTASSDRPEIARVQHYEIRDLWAPAATHFWSRAARQAIRQDPSKRAVQFIHLWADQVGSAVITLNWVRADGDQSLAPSSRQTQVKVVEPEVIVRRPLRV
jgi:hypothetical protein